MPYIKIKTILYLGICAYRVVSFVVMLIKQSLKKGTGRTRSHDLDPENHFIDGGTEAPSTALAADLPALLPREDRRTLAEFHPGDDGVRHGLHYAFAHEILPAYVHRDPDQVFVCFEPRQAGGESVPAVDPLRFAQSRWLVMELQAGLVPQITSVADLKTRPLRVVTDLRAWLQTVANKPGLIIGMPNPGRAPKPLIPMPLAYAVAVVLVAPGRARYFTLEPQIIDTFSKPWRPV